MASTESESSEPIASQAARGILPAWAEVAPQRHEHLRRVAELMEDWATALNLPPSEKRRWVAAGWLHDCLRDADPQKLQAELPPTFARFPAPLLHGPAAAERLRDELDAELRDAIRYHTTGHPSFGALGRALYVADFLEPGRDFLAAWRASLRARIPAEMTEVLVEVVAARIHHLLEVRKPIRTETAAFWSVLVGESQ